jgi:hypothetical protein
MVIMGTGERRRKIKLDPIYVALGAERVASLPGFHALTGRDITGHIQGEGMASCFKVFMKAGEDVSLCSCWAWCWSVSISSGVVWM